MSNTTTMRQTDACGNRLRVLLLEPNGEPAQLKIYINRLLATQDIRGWMADPAGLDKWLKDCICDYVNRCEVVIEGRAQ